MKNTTDYSVREKKSHRRPYSGDGRFLEPFIRVWPELRRVGRRGRLDEADDGESADACRFQALAQRFVSHELKIAVGTTVAHHGHEPKATR